MKTAKEKYLAPEVDLLQLNPSYNVLATLSVEGTIDDFEDGGEL